MYGFYETDFGRVGIESNGHAVIGLRFWDGIPFGAEPDSVTDLAARELAEYFAGARENFTVPLEPSGTDFQKAVWRELQNIPFGETRTYKQIAVRLGKPNAARAVGMANHRNPIAIMIPCHRIIGADGSLTGYAYGLDLKRKLLKLENRE